MSALARATHGIAGAGRRRGVALVTHGLMPGRAAELVPPRNLTAQLATPVITAELATPVLTARWE